MYIYNLFFDSFQPACKKQSRKCQKNTSLISNNIVLLYLKCAINGVAVIKLSILDDEPLILEQLVHMITEKLNKCYDIYTYISVHHFLNDIKVNPNRKPDVLLTDICFKDGDGIEVVKLLQETDNSLPVIYLSGYLENSTRIFETKPSYFLTKPININRLAHALNTAEQALTESRNEIINIPAAGGSFIRLYKNRIKYAESKKRKLVIHQTDTQTEIYRKLDETEQFFGKGFCRCHKSFLVNMSQIKEIKGNAVILFSGEEIPISKPNLARVKEEFVIYLGNCI